MTNLYSITTAVVLDEHAIATGNVTTKMAWEDAGEGKRKPSDRPELDEHGRPGHLVNVMLPFGRDGADDMFAVTVWSHEMPTPGKYTPVEFDGLRMNVRASRTGKGVDVSFSADGIRPAGGARGGRRQTETEAA